MLSADAYAEPARHFEPGAEGEAGWRTRSVLAVPLVHEGVVLGVVQLLNKTAAAGEAAEAEAEAEAEAGPGPMAVSLFGGDSDGDGDGDSRGDSGGGGGGGGGGGDGGDGGGTEEAEEEAAAAVRAAAARAAPGASFSIEDAEAVDAVGAALTLALLRWREEQPRLAPSMRDLVRSSPLHSARLAV